MMSGNIFNTFACMKYILQILLLLSFITACETDFDVNAPYQDITIVYGILDIDDSISYVKINKAFLGEGDAIVGRFFRDLGRDDPPGCSHRGDCTATAGG